MASDKYCSEVALKIDTAKDRGVRGGFQNPWIPPGYAPGKGLLKGRLQEKQMNTFTGFWNKKYTGQKVDCVPW